MVAVRDAPQNCGPRLTLHAEAGGPRRWSAKRRPARRP